MLACIATAQQRGNNQNSEKVAIGLRLGGNLPSYFYTETDELNALDRSEFLKCVTPMLGLHVEIPLLGGVVYVAPEATITQRGDSRFFHSTTLDTMVDYRARVNYLEARLPISIAIPVTPNFKPYVFAAPSYGWALQTVGPLKSEIVQNVDTVAVDLNNMSSNDCGLTLGAGLRFHLNLSSFYMIVKLEGGYHWGFQDTYSQKEHIDQVTALNANAYNVTGKRLNRGIEAALTIAIPLDFHPKDDCFYWSDIEKKKNRGRGLFGF